MENKLNKLDMGVKISIIAGSMIAALSVAYYFVILLPKNKELKSTQINNEASLNKAETLPPENLETIPQEAQALEEKEIAPSTETATTTATPTTKATKKKTLTSKSVEQKDSSDTTADAKAAAEAKAAVAAKAAAANVKTKIAIWNIDCSPSNIAETTAYYRQQGLDYIQKLRDEGEKIIDVREEKCRFIIVMEDNSK